MVSLFFPIVLAAFINPAIFYGGAAAMAVPIVIHLLNKRRFKTVIWAAMEFLLAAQRRNARKLRFRRWLLLAMRCLALLILGMAIAQFFLNDHLLANVLGGGGRAVVVVLDDSYSMGYRNPPALSHFEAAKKLLTDWVGRMGNHDSLAVVLASKGAGSFVEKPVNDREILTRAIGGLSVSDAGTDLVRGLDRALESLKEVEHTARTKTVVIVTDLSRSSLMGNTEGEEGDEGGETAAREAIRKKMAEVRAVAEVKIMDVGEEGQSNAAITGLETTKAAMVAGLPADVRVTVLNGTDGVLVDEPVTVAVDGVAAGSTKLPRMGPGEKGIATLSLVIPTAGRHMIEARIPGDLLAVDDVRRLGIEVARELPVLLVDGDPGDSKTFGGLTTLEHALLASGDEGGVGIFSPKVITELELARTPLGALGDRRAFVAVVLSDVGRLEPAVVESLKQYVTGGGMLMVFPGDRTNANEMNQTLGDSGAKLLPGAYGQMVRPEGKHEGEGFRFDTMNYAHPALAAFAAGAQSGVAGGFSSPFVDRYMRMTLPDDGTTASILKLSDGSVATAEKRIGKGRVVQFSFTADRKWTSLPLKPAFLEFMTELFFYGIARDAAGLTMELGGKIHLPADAAPAGTWDGPSGTKLQVVTEVGADGRAWLVGGPLTRAGVYSPTGAAGMVAVNVDEHEGDIRHVKPGEMAAAVGLEAGGILSGVRQLDLGGQENNDAGKNNGGDIGLRLLLVALAVLTLEAGLARMFSVYR